MKGFIKTVNGKHSQLININYIENIEYRAGCIEAETKTNSYIIYRPSNDFEDSEEFIIEIIKKIFEELRNANEIYAFIDMQDIAKRVNYRLRNEGK